MSRNLLLFLLLRRDEARHSRCTFLLFSSPRKTTTSSGFVQAERLASFLAFSRLWRARPIRHGQKNNARSLQLPLLLTTHAIVSTSSAASATNTLKSPLQVRTSKRVLGSSLPEIATSQNGSTIRSPSRVCLSRFVRNALGRSAAAQRRGGETDVKVDEQVALACGLEPRHARAAQPPHRVARGQGAPDLQSDGRGLGDLLDHAPRHAVLPFFQ